MRTTTLAFAVSLSLIVAQGLSAQTTADGVDAFVRGDYPKAAEILKPLAEERWSLSNDQTAAFFMAVMYENGLAVPRDAVRACALYLRASPAAPLGTGGPFAQRAYALAIALQRSMTAEQSGLCLLLTNIGFDHGFQPATFSLEPGHGVRFELSTNPQGIAATILHDGKETRVDAGLPLQPGVRFLPIEHTELAVGLLRQMRRHFIESFAWLEVGDRRWSLMWFVSEVVRDRLVAITTEEIVTFNGETPPTALPPSVRDMARLRVNDAGDAEWVLLKGPDRLGGVIETDAERREADEQRRAREAADARVDWTRVYDPNRPPALIYSGAAGCGNLHVYGWSDDRAEAISIRLNREVLQLSDTPQSFEIASRPVNIEVVAHLFEFPQRSMPFCTDVGGIGQKDQWRATGGTITVAVSPPGVRRREPRSYRATITLNGVTFVNASGARVTQKQPITLTAIVESGFH